jgi:hypothetical protein
VDDSSGRAGDRPTLLGMLLVTAQEAADILGVIANAREVQLLKYALSADSSG